MKLTVDDIAEEKSGSGKHGIEKKDYYFASSSGMCRIHAAVWYPDAQKYKKPLGVVQIAHGMIDHIERFDELACYLADGGFVVAGNAHLGHGDSVNSKDDWGYFAAGRNSAQYLVKDMFRLTRIMQKKYPGLPYALIGHSMGSYMARRYMMSYGDELDAAVILGTGNQSRLVVDAGLAAARLTERLRGERYRSALLNKMMFGKFNSRIASPNTASDWLTRREDIVKEYVDDEKCSYIFTANAYEGLLQVIKYVILENNIRYTPKELPILIASGAEDPVGDYGKAVERLYRKYQKYLDDVELRLYEECRHELHSEINAQEIFGDIYGWLSQRLKTAE